MGFFFNRGTRNRSIYEFDVAAAFENMNAFHEQMRRDRAEAKAIGNRQRRLSIAAIKVQALQLGLTAERAAAILLLACPHVLYAEMDYRSGRAPFQLRADMPFRNEIAIVLHLAIQQAVAVITKEERHMNYDLRFEIETLLLAAHDALA